MIIVDEKIYDRKHISDTFNIFFTTIGSELDKKISSDRNPIAHMTSINNSLFITEIDESDVRAVIMNLKNLSAGYDNIPASIAKELLNSYVTPLNQLINISFNPLASDHVIRRYMK